MASTPALIYPNGQPMRAAPVATAAVLKSEIAAPTVMGVRSIISGHPAQGLTPGRLAALLRAAEQGDAIAYLELAEEMEEKDLHYASVIGTRKRQVAQLPIEAVPAGDSEEEKADAAFVNDWLDRDLLEAEIFDILDAIGKGYSAIELIWAFSASAWLPDKLKWRDPRFFELDPVTGEELLLREVGPSTRLPAAKFIVHFHQAKSGIPIRGGIARAVAWGYMFKNYAIKDWVAFLETYGMPIRIGRYDNGEAEENVQTLVNALASLGSDAAAAFPRTMDVEFVDGKAGTAPNDLWKSMAQYIDEQVSKVVLGQTNTTDAQSGGLGSGQANVHNEVRGDIERADAKLLAATLNEQLVKPLVMLNRGPRARYPRLRIGRPEAIDVKGMTEALTALVPLGVEVSIEDARERAGLPAPKPGAKLLAPAAQAAQEPPPGPDGPGLPEKRPTGLLGPLKAPPEAKSDPEPAAASAIAPARPDPIEAAADEALSDWEALMEPLVAPVRSLVGQAGSFEELKASLASAIERMDPSEIAELLARSAFGARLAGDIAAGPTE